jgi:hypothetical protein
MYAGGLEGEDSEDDKKKAKAKMSEMTKHFSGSPISTTKPTGKQSNTPMNLWTNMLQSITGAARLSDIDRDLYPLPDMKFVQTQAGQTDLKKVRRTALHQKTDRHHEQGRGCYEQ